MYSVHHNNMFYHNLDLEQLVSLLGEDLARETARAQVATRIKEDARKALSRFDWMFVREYRFNETDTPKPVPPEVKVYYEQVIDWSAQEEAKILTMPAVEVDMYEASVPVFL
jgi:hypothetical protein